jgi:hypothetical protein
MDGGQAGRPTYTPSERVERLLARLKMPICQCEVDGDRCFRVVPEGQAYCVPCAPPDAYHGPGGRHGYQGTQVL